MKFFKSFAADLFAATICVAFTSCSNNDDDSFGQVTSIRGYFEIILSNGIEKERDEKTYMYIFDVTDKDVSLKQDISDIVKGHIIDDNNQTINSLQSDDLAYTHTFKGKFGRYMLVLVNSHLRYASVFFELNKEKRYCQISCKMPLF
jgi:hypothetical protein